jgi:cation diffusion facilitator CzcD-associated flavoprotein CzcO
MGLRLDKRVGIIGTGATAVQIVPHLGEWAKQLYVFQRTPSSIDVRGNKPTDAAWAKSLKKGWQKERMDSKYRYKTVCETYTDLTGRL